jgi:hypothetical protein
MMSCDSGFIIILYWFQIIYLHLGCSSLFCQLYPLARAEKSSTTFHLLVIDYNNYFCIHGYYCSHPSIHPSITFPFHRNILTHGIGLFASHQIDSVVFSGQCPIIPSQSDIPGHLTKWIPTSPHPYFGIGFCPY